MDFALQLQEMRRKWEKGLRCPGYLPRPYWMAKHRLAQTYKDAKILRKHGQVYYAAPERCKSILVLPKRYWTKEMKRYYMCKE